MESVKIGHNGSLFFEDPERLPGKSVDTLSVRVALDGLHASQRIVTINGFYDLSSFFKDLSLNWRGWSGTKTYESLEGDLVINAEHDGHIRLSFTLSQASKLQGWSLTAEVTLDPGEELTGVTQELESLLTG